MQECLVYLFTGFLESGKTTLIQETLNDPGFNTGEEKTLILLCEEGGVRYTKDLAQRVHADIVSVNAPEKMTAAFMEKCEQLFHPDRVMIEFNGMWSVDQFLDVGDAAALDPRADPVHGRCLDLCAVSGQYAQHPL